MNNRKIHRKIRMLVGWILVICLLCGITAVQAADSKDKQTKLIAFTFDDGPGDYTEMLLDGLEEREAVATFFMTGENGTWGVKKYGKIMDRMVELNCQMANHTYGHKKFSQLQTGELDVQLDGMENYLYKAMGGTYNEMVRIPGGENSDNVSTVKHPVITWNIDTMDWKLRDTTLVYQNILDGASDGSIVLLHDLYPSSVQGALHAMDVLKKDGYEFVTVSELFRRRGIELEDGTIYSDARSGEKKLAAYGAPKLKVEDSGEDTFKVSISEKEKGLTYYYTTDGSIPRLNSNLLDKKLDMKAGDTITVAGYDEYATRTPVTEKTFRTQEEIEKEKLVQEKEEKANNSFWVKLFRKLHIFGF